jgi:hypothetical protein
MPPLGKGDTEDATAALLLFSQSALAQVPGCITGTNRDNTLVGTAFDDCIYGLGVPTISLERPGTTASLEV